MKVKAQARFIRESPSKVRRVLDLVRGRPVTEAQAILGLTPRGAAQPVSKTLNSAIANAEHNHALDADELYVSEAFADEGPTLRRFRPRARGRATRINKRTSHITVVVSEQERNN
ncbi:MAG: 50S ribosomal protein L22 [Acidimicrobiia bacterium]|nr:50S ribosomal protein L22 [Acidimicrobiia bacterium]